MVIIIPLRLVFILRSAYRVTFFVRLIVSLFRLITSLSLSSYMVPIITHVNQPNLYSFTVRGPNTDRTRKHNLLGVYSAPENEWRLLPRLPLCCHIANKNIANKMWYFLWFYFTALLWDHSPRVNLRGTSVIGKYLRSYNQDFFGGPWFFLSTLVYY